MPDPFPVDTAQAWDGFVPLIGLAFSALAPPAAAAMAQGSIDGNVPPDTFSPGGAMAGTLSSSAVFVGGTFYGATALQDLGTAGNTSSVTFTYKGSEAAGGVAVGVRWNDSAQQGIFAFIDSSGPTLKIYEMSSGWVSVQTANTSLTLTSGNSYTLTLADNGSTVTASITDDSGVQTCNLSTVLNTGNTEVMFGWIGTTASYAFNAYITGFNPSQTGTVATSASFPVAGSYVYAQSVYLSTTPGATIYYTTDGSTPTTGSTRYTGPITVSATETVKALGVLAGWTNSSVASAAFTIVAWTMEAGTIDGNTSGAFTLTGSTTGVGSSSRFFTTPALTSYAALAYYDTGSTGNSPSVTFIWDSADATAFAGPMIGTRWNDSAQSGWRASFNGTNMQLVELSSGWTLVNFSATPVTLTNGNSYTIFLSDDGSTVTATIVDDTGLQSLSITDSGGVSDTEVAFGWITSGGGASYAFNAVIVGVSL